MERRDEKIEELEKWVNVMSDMNLKPQTDEAMKTVQKGLVVIDKLRMEKFNLKRELIFEKSQSQDLRTALLQLKQES